MTCVEHSWWFPNPCPKCNEQSATEDMPSKEEDAATLMQSPLQRSLPPIDTPPGVGPGDDPPFLQRNPDGSWKYPELTPGEPNVFISGFGWAKAS